jgi:hypothetical protein
MTKAFLLPLLFLSLVGCMMTSRPPDNTNFVHIKTIKELEGIYQNLGVREAGAPPIYLSSIIWPKDSVMNHAAILAVDVKVTGDRTLLIKAVKGNEVVKEDTFIERKDFEISSGRISLTQKAGIAGFKSGEPLIGPYYEQVELGLDQRGNGKYRSKGGVVGLVYSFLPIAMSSSEEVRFVKIKK